MDPFYAKTLQTSLLRAIAETSKRLIRVQFGEAVPLLADFLSRTDLPSQPSLRQLAVTTYVGSLIPKTRPHSSLAQALLSFAMLLDAGTTNDQATPYGTERADSAPEHVASRIASWASYMRPGEEDPLGAHLHKLATAELDARYENAMLELLNVIRRSPAHERRQAIALASNAMGLVTPPHYHRMRLVDEDGQSRFVLVRQDLELLSDAKTLAKEIGEMEPVG